MKRLFLLSAFTVLAVSASDGVLSPVGWRVFYTEKSSFRDGVLTGTPKNGGAALVRKITSSEVPAGAAQLCVRGSGFEADDLSLSLRGRTRVTVRKSERKGDRFVLSFSAVPEELREMRIYFNSRARYSGKPVSMKFDSIFFAAGEVYRPDMSVRRRRVFERTVIFPRIQSKYDLVKNYLSVYSAGTGNFVDRPLFFNRELADVPLPEYDKQNTVGSFRKQLEVARLFTDGLGIFYSIRPVRYMRPIHAAETAGMKNCVFMEVPGARLEMYKVLFPAIDATLKSPAVFKHRGALVIGSYQGDALSPERWKKILPPYRARYGKKVLFTVELRGIGYTMASHFRKTGGRPRAAFTEEMKKKIRAYLDVADGINFSASNHLNAPRAGFPENVFNAEAYGNYIIPVFVSVLAEEKYDGKKLLGLSAHRGYIQTRRLVSNVDDEGTASLRKSLTAALGANCDFIVMPEWNEINENTHMEPLVSHALTNVRVVNAVRGLPVADVEKKFPNVILSFRQENDLAAPIPVELLALPEKEASPSRITLRLVSPDGKVVKSYPQQTFSHEKIEEFSRLEPAAAFASYRYLVPELEILWRGKKRVLRAGLPHIRLTGAPNIRQCYVKIPLRDLPDPESVRSESGFEGRTVRVRGRASLPEKIMSVELLADENVLTAADPKKEFVPPPGMVMLRWMRSTPVTGGFAGDTVTLTAAAGGIRLRTPHTYSLTGMKPEQPRKNVISGRIGGGCNIRDFFFFATPDAVLKITSRKQTVEVAVRDVLAQGRLRFVGDSGVSMNVEHCTEQVEMPMPLNEKEFAFDLAAPKRPGVNTVYSLRIVTEAGRVYRGLPFMAAHDPGKPVKLPVFDLLDEKVKVIDVPEARLRNVSFEFSPRCGDVLPADTGVRDEDAMAGGFDYRTHSAPGWNILLPPRWRRENGRWLLDFKPGCGLLLCQPLFSRSAFDLELEASFSSVEDQVLLDVLGGKLPVRVRDGRLSGAIVTAKGNFEWRAEKVIEKNRFYTLRLCYDLTRLRVFLDGTEIASVPASGTVPGDGWVLCIGGVPEKTRPAGWNSLAKDEPKTTSPNTGFRFDGVLRALRIANFIVEK
ncbi:MAG: hypothetical protein IJU70_02380 [Lentisphaeria bacterium]|nr:hypothetical protein [Lentisphaeria bacterium]